MSFESLNKDELAAVAEFFNKDVVAADPEKGATKKELVASLASEVDSDPVTWDDYKDVYLDSDVKKAEDRKAAVEEEARLAAEADPDEPVDEDTPVEQDLEPESKEDLILVRMDRKNGTYETHGLRFTKAHPYKPVPLSVGESIIKTEKGFSIALPSEVEEYYN